MSQNQSLRPAEQEMSQEEIELQARRANSADLWDKLWDREGEDSWRKTAMDRTYQRVCGIMGFGEGQVLDIGGGVGFLAEQIKEKGWTPTIFDISESATRQARAKGIWAMQMDIASFVNECPNDAFDEYEWVIATEMIEHLSEETRCALLRLVSHKKCMFSVPNNRLGPDEEPQHTIKWTAKQFKDYLKQWFNHVRVEVLGPYMLGVCGVEKSFKMSVCFPARDEEKNIAATLASFRGVADEMIIGVDPRSKDRTWEIAEEYADEVFEIEEPNKGVPDGGVNFAWIRNQCMDRCTGDWIFMTEAHERLLSGEDTLLEIDKYIPEDVDVAFVFRTGRNGAKRERWGFPWLSRNKENIRYHRSTHNVLKWPDKSYSVRLPQVSTLHERHVGNAVARSKQRKLQNRKMLMEDWRVTNNPHSLFYLGQEWFGHDNERSLDRFAQFIARGKGSGEAHYQARLNLALLYWHADRKEDARKTLLGCIKNSWDRTEHWIWLGDIAFDAGDYEKALQFYLYGSVRINNPPFTSWWINLSLYEYIPAQRLAMTYGHLGNGIQALYWAKKVLDLLPVEAPAAAFEEAKYNIKLLEEIVNET